MAYLGAGVIFNSGYPGGGIYWKSKNFTPLDFHIFIFFLHPLNFHENVSNP